MSEKANSECWEFEAPVKEVDSVPIGAVGAQNNVPVANFSIGSDEFIDAVVTNAFCAFAQIPDDSFEQLVQEGLITRVLTQEDYARGYRERFGTQMRRGRVSIGEGRENEEDPYGLGLDSWREQPDVPVVRLALSYPPIEHSLEFYPFSLIGLASVSVQGKYAKHEFHNCPVTNGVLKVLGYYFLGLFSRLSLEPGEDGKMTWKGIYQGHR